MLKVYHAPGTRSARPVWLCYELELAFDVAIVPFTREFLYSEEWRAISPARKLPALVDGDVTMFESGAMVEYILEKYGEGRLRPVPGTPASASYHQWCWFAEATLIRPLGVYRVLKGRGRPVAELVADAEDKIHTSLSVVENALTGQGYLLGAEFSAADIMMGYSVALLERVMGDRYPNAKAYLNRVSSRPAYRKLVELRAQSG